MTKEPRTTWLIGGALDKAELVLRRFRNRPICCFRLVTQEGDKFFLGGEEVDASLVGEAQYIRFPSLSEMDTHAVGHFMTELLLGEGQSVNAYSILHDEVDHRRTLRTQLLQPLRIETKAD